VSLDALTLDDDPLTLDADPLQLDGEPESQMRATAPPVRPVISAPRTPNLSGSIR
jgi:hypothetical protein